MPKFSVRSCSLLQYSFLDLVCFHCSLCSLFFFFLLKGIQSKLVLLYAWIKCCNVISEFFASPKIKEFCHVERCNHFFLWAFLQRGSRANLREGVCSWVPYLNLSHHSIEMILSSLVFCQRKTPPTINCCRQLSEC